jgi:hypothetical protein
MTDEDFRSLCNTFGFAPSRALRELIDCVRRQEIEACAKVCEEFGDRDIDTHAYDCASAIRARSNT